MERSLTTIRVLKVALPILFIAFIIVIVAFYTQRSATGPADEMAAERPEREGEQARLISYEFEDTQTIGDRVISRIRAARTVGFESGWYTLDRAELDIFREDGGVYTLTAPSAEFNAETKEARAEGGVIVSSDDGLDLRTESIVFNGSRLTNRIPVRFRMNQWSGTARGADLDVERDTLELSDGVEVSFEGEGPESFELTSRSATFERTTGSATFEHFVKLIHEGDRYQSNVIKAQVDQNRNRLIGLEGSGRVELDIASGSTLVAPGAGMEGAKKIAASWFVGKFDGDGEMTAIEVFGDREPVRVELLGDPLRSVEARSARVNLGENGAESLELFSNVILTEPALERTMRAERLVITFDQGTGQATSAVFDGDVRYEDPSNRATSHRVFYDVPQGVVKLSSVPGSAPTITSGPQRISADEITVEPDGQVLRATGRVITRIVNTSGADNASESALFPSDGAIFVNSNGLVLRQDDGFAAFTGDVRAWQGNNTLLTDDLQIRSGGANISARGNVRTILENTGSEGSAPVKSRSDRLEAARAENRIELIDEVVIESEGRTLESDQAVFIFGPEQELDRVTASGNIKLRDTASGRSGTGDKAVYEIREETILVEGTPAEIREARGTIKGEQIVLDLKRNRVDVLRGDSPTEATYNPDSGDR